MTTIFLFSFQHTPLATESPFILKIVTSNDMCKNKNYIKTEINFVFIDYYFDYRVLIRKVTKSYPVQQTKGPHPSISSL